MTEKGQQERADYSAYIDEDRIHWMVFHKATREAIYESCDVYIKWRRAHLEANGNTGEVPFLMMFDIRPDGLPPIRFTFNRFQTLFRDYPMPRGARAGYLMPEHNDTTLSVMRGLFELLRLGTQRRFFYGPDAETQARAFLLEQDNAES